MVLNILDLSSKINQVVTVLSKIQKLGTVTDIFYNIGNFPITCRLKDILSFRQKWIGKFYPKGALQLKHVLDEPF